MTGKKCSYIRKKLVQGRTVHLSHHSKDLNSCKASCTPMSSDRMTMPINIPISKIFKKKSKLSEDIVQSNCWVRNLLESWPHYMHRASLQGIGQNCASLTTGRTHTSLVPFEVGCRWDTVRCVCGGHTIMEIEKEYIQLYMLQGYRFKTKFPDDFS